MHDRIVKSLKDNKLVFWEEVARDGAQAKTILSGKQRVEVANANAALFNGYGQDHLIFAAGFPSIGKGEFEAIRYLVDNVDSCYLAPNGRAIKTEIDLCIKAVKGAKYGRIAFVHPMSERLADLMMHKTLKETSDILIDMARYALDKSDGIPVDLQLAAAPESDPTLIAEVALQLTEEGIATVGIGDSFGKIYPNEMIIFLDKILNLTYGKVIFSTHFHNDICFALYNNIEAIKRGIRLITTSWLGLGERNGLLPAEQLLFLMAYEPENLEKRLGIDGHELFYSNPDLKDMTALARLISELTNIPLKVTDALIGPGVNSLSTGTPFVDINTFQPFDTEKILGIEQKVYVTQLASKRVIRHVAKEIGYNLTEDQIIKALEIVKQITYERNQAVVEENELTVIFEKVLREG